MTVRKHLNLAMGELVTARRRSEEKNYRREFLYNMEVLIRACSRVKDQVDEEDQYAKQKEEEALRKINKQIQEKNIRRLERHSHSRAKSKKKIKKTKQASKRSSGKVAA